MSARAPTAITPRVSLRSIFPCVVMIERRALRGQGGRQEIWLSSAWRATLAGAPPPQSGRSTPVFPGWQPPRETCARAYVLHACIVRAYGWQTHRSTYRSLLSLRFSRALCVHANPLGASKSSFQSSSAIPTHALASGLQHKRQPVRFHDGVRQPASAVVARGAGVARPVGNRTRFIAAQALLCVRGRRDG